MWSALIIANTEYTDPGLAQLTAPGKDAEDFARVLKSPDICRFDDVNILLNQPSFVVSEAIDVFFYQKKLDDLPEACSLVVAFFGGFFTFTHHFILLLPKHLVPLPLHGFHLGTVTCSRRVCDPADIRQILNNSVSMAVADHLGTQG